MAPVTVTVSLSASLYLIPLSGSFVLLRRCLQEVVCSEPSYAGRGCNVYKT